ncbi:MAG: hypothetical protein ACTSXK_10895 [Promethearchaeota archaeon]
MVKILQKSKKIVRKMIFYVKKFVSDDSGGSMIESGLLIALSLILFLMLIMVVTDIYGWIETKFNEVISFFI